MDIIDYFKKNEIIEKSIFDVTTEHLITSKIKNNNKYYNSYYKTNLDDFIDCVDYKINLDFFKIVSNESKKYLDLFEPCCQSGLLSCFVYLNNPNISTYKGIDINEFAIKKAKDRTKKFFINENIFETKDLFEYNKQHEAIIGRYIINNSYNYPDNNFIEKIKQISNNLILIQAFQKNNKEKIKQYIDSLTKHGFITDILYPPIISNATKAMNFVLKAYKK
jgi:SAM-dependent methyltransferase